MENQTLYFSETTLPLLYNCDILVVGASLGGIASALTLAQAGKRVMVLEARTYPAYEMTARLRPWLEHEDDIAPEWFKNLADNSGTEKASGEIAFNLDSLKIQLEDLLLDADVKLLYASIPIGYRLEDDKQLVIIGNKGGRQLIQCSQIVDASAEHIIERLENTSEHTVLLRGNCGFTLEFDNISSLDSDILSAPENLQLKDNLFHLHRGYRSPQHLLVECQAEFPSVPNDAFGDSKRLTHKSQLAIDSAIYLMQQPAFKNAYLAGISYELHPLRKQTEPCQAENHWRINENQSIFAQIQAAEAIADQILSGVVRKLTPQSPPVVEKNIIHIHEIASETSQKTKLISSSSVPIVREVDVLVIGGGTSGATSAYIAGKQGMKTLLVEMNPGLGGTGTFGGVHSYWFGRRVGFSAELSKRVNAVHKRMGHRLAEGVLPKWNIEVKSHTLMADAANAGVEILLNAITIGVLRENDAVCGVVVATRFGVIALKGKIIIDATGDADIAAQAGADVVYGSARDHTTMWYALAQFARPGLTQNHFTSTVDVSSAEDYTRAILAGRRRKRNDNMHDHGIYIAPRESRHIRGEVVLTLTDQLLKRAWHDTVNITFSNHDIKGHTTSDWLRIGLIPPNLLIEIPYRALLPNNLENIIVVGKAMSATHDALPAIRMQADLENLGGVAGLAASLAVKHKVSARNIPIQDLQSELVKADVLPETILTRELQAKSLDNEHLQNLIERVAKDQALYLYSDMDLNAIYEGDLPLVDLVCSDKGTIAHIESYLATVNHDEQLKLAIALALMGSEKARPILLQELINRLSQNPLPIRQAHIHHTQLPPDQGAMPEECNLLYALGMVADESILPLWSQLIDQLSEVDSDDLRDEMQGIFYYVDSICFGIERLGSPQAIQLLKRLHNNPIFQQQMSDSGFQIDYFLERQAYLEIIIARTLAGCGSVEGYRILINYLSDSRALLAKHALSELKRLRGQHRGFDSVFWERWLLENESKIEPQAMQHHSEIQDYWQETILIPTEQNV